DTEGQHAVCLEAATYSVGRDSSNSIVLHSRLVSRQHAILLRVTAPETPAYSFRIIDGNLQGKRSTNGLIINGRRCFSHDLKHRDIVVFGGDVKARYYAVANVSDAEFSRYCETGDFSGLLSSTINPFETVVPFVAEPENFQEAALVRLASFPELIPHPILEIDLLGVITYLNPAAILQFPDLHEAGLQHPMLQGLLQLVNTAQGEQEKFFVREVEVEDKVFEQSIHYISESDLIRTYIADVTQRKRAEEKLRQQAQREAIINRIVQAMRGTLVCAQVLQITADLLPEALAANHCLIIQTSAVTQGSAEYVSQSATRQDHLIKINFKFTEYFRTSLTQGEQVFLSSTDKLTSELEIIANQCRIQALLITPLLYLGEYLGNISLYQTDSIGQMPTKVDRCWTLEERSLAGKIADQCAIAIHQAQLYQQVQDLNAKLERQVQERTAELQQKMQELQRLNVL
ncbi:MAG TPA: FHA domain-containing protein, partial [Candidatus Caenarcaniphilales bacterium]